MRKIFLSFIIAGLASIHCHAQESTLETADGNADGTVTVKEFAEYASTKLQGFDKIDAFAKKVDANGDGEIDEDEFANRMQMLQQLASEDSDADSSDEIVLFDGTNLDHWRGYKQEAIGKGWVVEDGSLKFKGGGGGDIITRETFTNFEFSFEWKVTEGANSGVMYKVGLGDGAPYLTGPEYQILDNNQHQDGRNQLTSAASLYGLYAPESPSLKPVGEWNTGKIVISGDKVQHFLNGEKVVETEIGGEDWKERVANSKFKDWEKFGVNKTGHLCLQDHGDEVWYRNIKIKKLED